MVACSLFRRAGLIGLALIAGASCSSTPTDPGPDGVRTFSFDFRQGPQGWAPGAPQFYGGNTQLVAEYRPLSGALASQGSAFFARTYFVGATVYFKRKVSGLSPTASYRVNFSSEIATDTPSRCLTFGGEFGEDTHVLVGATTSEPTTSYSPSPGGPDFPNSFSLGRPDAGGANGFFLGNVATPLPCPVRVWQLKTLQGNGSFARVTTDSTGSAWLIQATTTAIEATIGFYFTRYSATFTPE